VLGGNQALVVVLGSPVARLAALSCCRSVVLVVVISAEDHGKLPGPDH
jgi:hypothetical protein